MGGYLALEQVHEQAGQRAEAVPYGTSVQGRPLIAYRTAGEGAPLLVTAGIHGLEFIGVATALRALDGGSVGGHPLLVVPVINPDGYQRTWDTQGRERLAPLRKNANGVDLNRNFPLPWGRRPTRVPFAGTDDPTSATFRGSGALSEPESRHLDRLLQERRPHAAVNLHSFMGTLITPKVLHREDWMGYRTLARAFRAAGGTYPRIATPILDVFTGELEDHQHHTLGCWATCVESFSLFESLRQSLRARSPFERFNPHDPQVVATRDSAAVRGLLAAALTLPPVPSRPGAAPLTFPVEGPPAW